MQPVAKMGWLHVVQLLKNWTSRYIFASCTADTPNLAGRYLDVGPTGILVPEVMEEVTVDDAIASFYYLQVGRRSWSGIARRGIKARGDQLNRVEYAEWWNKNGVLFIQIGVS